MPGHGIIVFQNYFCVFCDFLNITRFFILFHRQKVLTVLYQILNITNDLIYDLWKCNLYFIWVSTLKNLIHHPEVIFLRFFKYYSKINLYITTSGNRHTNPFTLCLAIFFVFMLQLKQFPPKLGIYFFSIFDIWIIFIVYLRFPYSIFVCKYNWRHYEIHILLSFFSQCFFFQFCPKQLFTGIFFCHFITFLWAIYIHKYVYILFLYIAFLHFFVFF